MRLALLPAFVLAMAALGWSGLHTHAAFASTFPGVSAGHAGLYSVAAQATTTATVSTAASPTTASTGTAAATAAATSAVTATTVPANTPVPLPTAATSSGNLQLNPLNWNFLTSAAPDGLGAFGPFAWIYLVLMLALLGAGAYFYFIKRTEWKRTNTVYRRAAERFAPPAMWLGGITILFMLFRVIHLDGLNIRLWLYLCFLALIALAVWFYYWYSRRMPGELAKFQKTQRARQYMPAAKKGSTRPAVTPKPNNVRTGASTSTTATTSATTPGQQAARTVSPKPGAATTKRKKRR